MAAQTPKSSYPSMAPVYPKNVYPAMGPNYPQIGSKLDNKISAAKYAIKNKQSRLALYHRHQTLDSGYGSDTILNAATTGAINSSRNVASHVDPPKVKLHLRNPPPARKPQPYDGLLTTTKNKPYTREEIQAHISSVRSWNRHLFEDRYNKDWRNIPVFYDDDERKDRDEVYASRVWANKLRTIRPQEESDDEEPEEADYEADDETEVAEEEFALTRSRLASLFGEVPGDSAATPMVIE